jgi:hypothetical protein
MVVPIKIVIVPILMHNAINFSVKKHVFLHFKQRLIEKVQCTFTKQIMIYIREV